MRIVVATDLTDASADAARYAVRRARQLSLGITVVHVVGSQDVDVLPLVSHRYQIHEPEPAGQSVVDDAKADFARESRAWFEETVDDLDGIDVDHAVEFGDLPEVLWRIASEKDARIVVVGVKGRQSVGRKLSRILLDATRPVVVVRQGTLAEA
ncbi:MAG: universal stress protein [Actinomycetota bacterium]